MFIKKFFSYTEPNGWVSVHTPVMPSDGNTFLTLLYTQEETEHYKHVVKIETNTGEVEKVSHGKMSVSSITGWDKSQNLV